MSKILSVINDIIGDDSFTQVRHGPNMTERFDLHCAKITSPLYSELHHTIREGGVECRLIIFFRREIPDHAVFYSAHSFYLMNTGHLDKVIIHLFFICKIWLLSIYIFCYKKKNKLLLQTNTYNCLHLIVNYTGPFLTRKYCVLFPFPICALFLLRRHYDFS